MAYRVQITDKGKTWLLPATYTLEEAEWEVMMQQKLNRLNIIMGEPPAEINIVECGKIIPLQPKRRDTI